jgi:hypothetical protein
LAEAQETRVKNFLDAQGGYGKHVPVVRRAVGNARSEVGVGRDYGILGKRASEWTDSEIDAVMRYYRDCDAKAEARARSGSPENMEYFGRELEREFRDTIARARELAAERAATEKARQAAAEDQAREAEAQRSRAEEQKRAAEAELRRRSEAMGREASERARRDREMAAELTRQAEAEEQRLAEARREASAAEAERRAAEERLARIRSEREAEERRARDARTTPSVGATSSSPQGSATTNDTEERRAREARAAPAGTPPATSHTPPPHTPPPNTPPPRAGEFFADVRGMHVAQPLEESFLTLLHAGAHSVIKKREHGTVVIDDQAKWEVRVLDEASCAVRVTDLEWTPTTEVRSDFRGSTITVENALAHRDYFLDRVIASNIRKISEVLEAVKGRLTRERPDAIWLLAGNYGDELWCSYRPGGKKTCWDKIEFRRGTGIDAPDESERIQRVDRAMVRVFGDLCKGAPRKTPF